MNDIVGAHANTAIHVILDNLNTHKPKNDRWLKRHSNVHFPLHTDAGLLAQLGTVREVSPRFVSDCCSPTNSLDKARALFAAYGKRRPRLTIREELRCATMRTIVQAATVVRAKAGKTAELIGSS
jgi:hypothetical protein